MKALACHRLAASELIASAKFYERQRATLGAAFLAAVDATLAYIQRHPELGRPGNHSTCSRKTARFPFRIVYREEAGRLWIVAVSHLSRRPDYWNRRLH